MKELDWFEQEEVTLNWHEQQAPSALLKTPVFEVVSSERRSCHHQRGTFYYLDLASWVVVIPLLKILKQRHFVVVRQFRQAVKKQFFEFPAGVMEEGETPSCAAQRELREETGYCCEKLFYLGSSHPNPALMTNSCHTFLAFVDPQKEPLALELDENELLQVELVSEESMGRFFANNFCHNAIVLQAYFYYERWAKQEQSYEQRRTAVKSLSKTTAKGRNSEFSRLK